ncbi:hypothetical protein [Paenibacillus sp. ISL-20]|uniref:hypothetical protein n=1 Tax=Paenibacillus sp. ISL-20 TaxID=2819163 RepID=UPI0020352579|nr:hypothetical protein [Paenibacillus sp. ISL-20]
MILEKLKYGSSSLIVILLVVSTGLSVYLPVFHLPKPDGPEKVGTQTFHFTDLNRDEVLTEDQSDKRELMVQVWYPTENSTILYSITGSIVKPTLMKM